jgi:hypothetical protein
MPSGMVANGHDPMAEVERMAEEFRSTASFALARVTIAPKKCGS